MSHEKKYVVTKETKSGRNKEFKNVNTGRKISDVDLVGRIERGLEEDMHIRVINGVKTPVTNPDKSKKNNLG